MTLLLVHFLLLTLVSQAMARRMVRDGADRVIATMVLFWVHIVALCLLLSCAGKLGHPAWFFRGSIVLAAATFFVVRRFTSPEPAPATSGGAPRSWLLVITAAGTLLPILAGNLAIAAAYEPNNYDSLTYHLPRSMYYLGQNSLAHFETADFRQVYYPFNFNLLQLFCFVYGAPIQSVTFFNIAAWVLTGLGVFRIARLGGCSFNASLLAAWLTLTSLEVLAQATSTILDMPAGAALVATLAFALRWRITRRGTDAMLAGIAASLGLGTKLTVAFFGPAAVLLVLAIGWHHWRRGETPLFLRGIRAWIGPGVLAGVLLAPFILYNLAAAGEMMTNRMDFTLNKPFSIGCAVQTTQGYLVQIFCEPLARFTFDLDLITSLNQWFNRHVFQHWNEAYAFSALYTIPPDLNEDHVFFGFAGPLLLICAVICLARDWRLQRPITWVALLGLGWFVTYFATNKWSLYNQRYFVPPLVVLGPCAAAVFDAGRSRLKLLLFGAVVASGVWMSLYYLVKNNIRPLPLAGVVRPSIVPDVPPLLAERLAREPRLNITSYGTNERIFPLMHLGKHQQITSGSRIDPGKYNVFSYWGNTRNHIYSNLAYYASYTTVAVTAKRTAGVEFLGTVPGSADDFDYLGLPAHANETPASPGNSHVAVYVEYEADTNDPVRLRRGKIGVIGLNPRDAARMLVTAEMADGTRVTLLDLTSSGVGPAVLEKPFKRLVLEVTDTATGQSLGRGVIPFTVRLSEAPAMALNPTTRFSADMITGDGARHLALSGLASPEGPYPQWDLPRFRWAKQPAVRLVIPADDSLRQIRLTFSARPQVRDEAGLEVVQNGRVVQNFRLNGRAGWLNQVLTLTPGAGENVIELRDRSTGDVPDWLAYLEQNPDVKQSVIAQGQPLEQGAQQHYELHGRGENRALPRQPNPVSVAPPESLYFAYRTLRVEGLTAQ